MARSRLFCELGGASHGPGKAAATATGRALAFLARVAGHAPDGAKAVGQEVFFCGGPRVLWGGFGDTRGPYFFSLQPKRCVY